MKRRSLLKVGAATGVLLALAGGALTLIQPARREGRLTEAGRSVFAALAPVVLDGMLPAEGSARSSAIESLLARIEASVAGMPPALQGEVDELITLLATPPGRMALMGLMSDWPRATPEEKTQAMQGLRHSRLALRQQVFHALRDLTNAAYFADAGTWAAIGYPGQQAL